MLPPIHTYSAQPEISVPSLLLPHLSLHWKMKQLPSFLASMFCSQLIADYQHLSSLERVSSLYSLCMIFSAYTWRKIAFHLSSSFASSIVSLFSEFILSQGFNCSFKVMGIINHCVWVTGSYIYFCIHLPQSPNHCRSVLNPSEEIKEHCWWNITILATTRVRIFSVWYSTSLHPPVSLLPNYDCSLSLPFYWDKA